nr:hypothetical protein [Mycobacterium tuberculosis]
MDADRQPQPPRQHIGRAEQDPGFDGDGDTGEPGSARVGNEIPCRVDADRQPQPPRQHIGRAEQDPGFDGDGDGVFEQRTALLRLLESSTWAEGVQIFIGGDSSLVVDRHGALEKDVWCV